MSALGKPAKRSEPSSDQVIVNAGGTKSQTCIATLSNSSTYFVCVFSDRWRKGRDNDDSNGGVSEVYLDMDPAQFTTLLSYMQRGCIDAGLITPELLHYAQFLGMDRLIQDAQILARREHFEGNLKNTWRAVALGLPNCGIIAAETCAYAQMNIFYADDATFEMDRTQGHEPDFLVEDDLLMTIEVKKRGDKDPETSLTGCVRNVATIVDGLNWLHKNGFTRLDMDHIPPSIRPKWLMFKRLLENEEDTGSIVHRGIAGANKPKQFAMSVTYESSREGGNKKCSLFADTGQIVERQTGILCGVRGVHDDCCETRAARIDDLDDHLHVMTWLQKHGFDTANREEALEKAIEGAYNKLYNKLYPMNDRRSGSVTVSVWSCSIDGDSKDDE